MLMKKKIIYISILLLITSSFSFAQGGSIYSRYGIGDIIHSYSARRMGFGNLGSAVIDKDYVDGYNPASWSSLYFTRFSLSAKMLAANYSDNSIDVTHTKIIFSGFTFGFPIQRDYGISAALGLIPISNLRYNIKKNIQSPILGDFSENFEGKGSLSKVFLGFSFRVPTQTSLGATFEYYTGTNNYYSSQDFSDNPDFRDISYQTTYKYHGVGTTLSLITGNVLDLFSNNNNSQLRFSFLTNLVSELGTDTSIIAKTSIGEIEKLNGETTTILPNRYTLGASFAWNKKYLLMFDYLYQPFSKYQFNGKYDNHLKDLVKLSVGFEYKDKSYGIHATNFERMSLRLGVSYEETQYTFNGININQYSVHAGIAFPFSDVNYIDFSLAAGVRGTTDANLIQEKFISATFTLTLAELWFVRPDR